jgi:hypothetical protein
MKFQSLLIAGLLLVPCFVANAKVTVTSDNQEPMYTEVTQGAEGCECLALPTPMLEKVSTRCSVKCNCPSTCFQVCKTVNTVDTYKIPSNCNNCCTITDENGTRDCSERPCPVKCEKTCRTRCERRCPRRCNRCAE